MQLSLHSDYALRVLMALATGEQRLSVDQIARRYSVSRNHLAKVAQRLQAQGFVTSYRGRGGGMHLARPASEIVVGDVVRRFENLQGFVSCFAGGGGCAVNGLCALKPALGGAIEAFLTHLDGFRLSDLVPDRAAFVERLERTGRLAGPAPLVAPREEHGDQEQQHA
jgi:Rrf2 family nitric oxide-sensitive transcriptional repressor